VPLAPPYGIDPGRSRQRIARLVLGVVATLRHENDAVGSNAGGRGQPEIERPLLHHDRRECEHGPRHAGEDLPPELEATPRQLEPGHVRADDHRVGGNAECSTVERMLGRGRNVPIRIHAAIHRQRPLKLECRALRQIRISVGELEIDGGEADGPGARDVCDLHTGRLRRQDARLRTPSVRRQVDQDVEASAAIAVAPPAPTMAREP